VKVLPSDRFDRVRAGLIDGVRPGEGIGVCTASREVVPVERAGETAVAYSSRQRLVAGAATDAE
jgi:hypothetical protein